MKPESVHRSETTAQLAKSMTARLAAAGIEQARFETRLLLDHILGEAGASLLHPERVLTADERNALHGLLDRRLAREPLAQVIGEKEFWSLPFRVTGNVLTPRADTETLVEAAARQARCMDSAGGVRILDLGTGSGCILLALLTELPEARGTGIDSSAEAVDVARDNAGRLGLQDRATFATGAWCDGLDGEFDLVVANPPYIPTGEIGALEPEVRLFEPRLALDGGPDGLDAYCAIALAVGAVLAPAGRLILEVGAGQTAAVTEVVERGPLRRTEVIRDLAGHERVLVFARESARGTEKNGWKFGRS